MVYGTPEPEIVILNAGYLQLNELADSAWSEMELRRDLLMIYEDNGDR